MADFAAETEASEEEISPTLGGGRGAGGGGQEDVPKAYPLTVVYCGGD